MKTGNYEQLETLEKIADPGSITREFFGKDSTHWKFTINGASVSCLSTLGTRRLFGFQFADIDDLITIVESGQTNHAKSRPSSDSP